MTSDTPNENRGGNSFTWLAFGFVSAVIAAIILFSIEIGRSTISESYIRSIEGLLLLILGSIWSIAAFFGIARGFRKI